MLRFKRVASAIALAIVAACGKGPGFIEPPPVETVTVNIISPANGQSLEQSAWPDSPVEIRVSAVSSLRGNINIVTVKLDGNIVGNTSVVNVNVSVGSHTVEACAKGVVNPNAQGCATVTFSIVSAAAIVVEIVRGFTLGPVSCDRYHAFVRRGSLADTAVFSNCRANISPRLRLLPDTGRVELVVDVIAPSERTHYGAIASIKRDSLSFNQKFVLVPLRYQITSGRWTGEVVTIELEGEAMAPPIDSLELYKNTVLGGIRFYLLGTWPASKLPVPWAIDREGSLTPWSAEDSVKVANHLDRFNADVGRVLFRPANVSELEIKSQSNNGNWKGIRLVFNTEGATCRKWGEDKEDIWAGTVDMGASWTLDNKKGVRHEFMHCLGFGHSVYTDGLMWGGNNDSDPLSGTAIPKDVAYLHVRYDVQELRRQSGAQYGIPQAHQWQRVFMLSPPLPIEQVIWK